MSNTNNLTRKPENFFLVCLFIVTALDVISTVYTKNLKILDMALVVLCVISAFSIIGTSLMNAGKDKSLEFGVIAGRYIRLVSIAIGSVICFLALVLAYSVFKDEMHSVNWIFFTAILILRSLLVIAFGIIEKLLTAQKSHREESQRLSRLISNTNRLNEQALPYMYAWKKLCDDITREEVLSGNEVIHRFRLHLDENRERLRTKHKNKRNKQTNGL